MALLVFAASAIESFVPASPASFSADNDRALAFGSGWIAYGRDFETIEVADRATGQVILEIPKPADNTPVPGHADWNRNVYDFGDLIAADGNRLAMICRSRLSPYDSGYSLFLWEIPSGRLVGIADLVSPDFGGTPVISLTKGRIVVAAPESRTIRSWDAANLAPFPDLRIPDALPPPRTAIWGEHAPIKVGGDHLIYWSRDAAYLPWLGRLNLASRTVEPLSLPQDFHPSPYFCLNHERLILTGFTTQIGSCISTYDLAKAEYGPLIPFPEGTTSDLKIRPVISDDGRWSVLGTEFLKPAILISGTTSPETPVSTVSFDLSAPDLGDPVAIADGCLWFKPNDTALPGTVAFKQASTGTEDITLTLKSLPAHESDGVLKVVVSASSASGVAVNFRLRTVDGSAHAGSDYQAQNLIHVLWPGETETIIAIPLVQDLALETSEHFMVEVSGVSGHALLVQPRLSCVIKGGSSYQMLPPLASWQESADCLPTDLAMTAGSLIQVNSTKGTATSTAPVILRRPFSAGNWEPTQSWGRAMPPQGKISFHGVANGLALLREFDTASVYDPGTDQVPFRLSVEKGNSYRDSISGSHVISRLGAFNLREHQIASPHAVREVNIPYSSIPHRTVYTGNYLVCNSGYGGLHLFSRTDGSPAGIIGGMSGWNQAELSASGAWLTVRAGGRIWYCNVDGDRKIRELLPQEGRFQSVSSVVATNGKIHVTERKGWDLPRIRIFEMTTGVEVDTLFQRYHATRLPGSPVFDEESEWTEGFKFSAISAEGRNAALMYWRNRAGGPQDFHVMRFTESDKLPVLAEPAGITEGSEVVLRLSEAVAWPLTVSAKAIVANRTGPDVWSTPTAPVTVPAGVTSFPCGLVAVEDTLPEDSLVSALEITITGNGVTETQRVQISLADDDRMSWEDVPMETTSFNGVFAPLGDGWAYRHYDEGGTTAVWTEDPDFNLGSPVGPIAGFAFPNAMASADGWLAIAQGAIFRGNRKKVVPQVYLYRPEEGSTPSHRAIKLPKNSGIPVLHARGTSLWVGTPGWEGNTARKTGSTFVREYSLQTGKPLRVYEAPKGATVSFGGALASNDAYLWVGQPQLPSSLGAIYQYSRANGKLVRTIPPPPQGYYQFFGSEFLATPGLLLTSSIIGDSPTRQLVQALSPETGEVLWSLDRPWVGWPGSQLAILHGNILVVGEVDLAFYLLTPGEAPKHLVELQQNPGTGGFITEVIAHGDQLAIQRNSNTFILDLRNIPQLQPYLPAPPANPPLAPTAKTSSQPEHLLLSQAENGWLLSVPPIPPAWEQLGIIPVLESSEDLVEWTPVARYVGSNRWNLHDETGAPTPQQKEGGDFTFPKGPDRRYFRLKLDPSSSQ